MNREWMWHVLQEENIQLLANVLVVELRYSSVGILMIYLTCIKVKLSEQVVSTFLYHNAIWIYHWDAICLTDPNEMVP